MRFIYEQKRLMLLSVILLSSFNAFSQGSNSEYMSIADLPSDIGTNIYGTQNVTDESTWLSWTWSNVDFKGVRICKATDVNGGGIQFQGNASDASKQGFIFNNTAWPSGIRKVTIVLMVKNATTMYDPSYTLYVGQEAHPTTTAITPTSTTEDVDGFRVYTQVFDLANTSAKYFTISNNKAGALYIDKIYIEPMIIGPVQIDGIYYNINPDDGCVSVTNSGSSGSYSGSMEIPSTVTYNDNLYTVTSIGSSAFEGCSDLISVTIPNSVTSIGNSAFMDCGSLEMTAISDGVITIGEKAFRGCNALTSITIPKSVISIGRLAFGNCNGLSTIQVEIDNPIYDSRDNCNAIIETATNSLICGIQNTLIPVNVTSIGEAAFYKCEGLVTISIPENMTTIGEAAFYGCKGLTNISIPEDVDSIKFSTFYGCENLTSITIPNSVRSIGMFAFRSCSSLTTINIPEGVDSIGRSAFYNCERLASITIPNSVRNIGMFAFYGCKGLANIIIPDGVGSIGRSTFYGCESLKSITIPNSVKGIGMFAFYGCKGLTSINIPEGVDSIGRSTFYGCESLTSLTIPRSLTSIGVAAFYGCKTLTSISIPENLAIIGEAAFYKCEGLSTINIPKSVTSVGPYVFYGCTALTSIIIPDGVGSIGRSTFYGCESLTSITIPNSVKDIGMYAFRGCSSLTDFYCVANNVPQTGSYIFYNSPISSATLHVPESAIDDYKSTEPWSGFGTIVGVGPEYILGDANGNGEVEIGDVTSVLTLMATPEATGYNKKAADANKNGEIEIGDVTTILTIMAGGE